MSSGNAIRSVPGAALFALLLCAGSASCQQEWMIGPFERIDTAESCLLPSSALRFTCPVRGTPLGWESKDLFNPAAVVREGKVYLLYRAQDSLGKPAGTSRIGLAWSTDGVRFTKHPVPVLYPGNDFMKTYEWEGGCEDPRIVRDGHGRYVMTYTAYDGRLARLAVATSADLIHWKKEGLAFGRAKGGAYENTWSKSGSVVCEERGGDLLALRIGGLYRMYWGEGSIHMATSDDLVHWTPVEDGSGALVSALGPRAGSFDSDLVEPGPPAVMTGRGILLMYNACNARRGGDPELPAGAYCAGQALFDRADPGRLLERSASYFFRPEKRTELSGQVNNVCFLEGLVRFRGKWLLYYGEADSRVGVAVSAPR